MTMHYKEKQFSIVWEKGRGGKAEPSLGLPLHLTSGFDCVRSLSLCLPFMIYLASHIGFIVSSSSLTLPPLFPPPSSLTHPAIVGCQSINKQLASDSFSSSAALPLSFSLALALAPPNSSPPPPPSPLAVCTMCISIYPNVITRFNMSAGGRGRVHYSAVFFISQCNVDCASSSGAGLGRECVHHVASAVMDTFGFFSTVIYT